VDPREIARWLRITSSNRLINLGPDWTNTGQGGSTFGGAEFCTDAATLAAKVEAVGEVNWPREVARTILGGVWSYRQMQPESGFIGPGQRRQDTTATATATATATIADMLTIPTVRQDSIPLMVELCAGLAAVSLTLQGGPDARPPVSRMGNKRGYAAAILWACGLRQGQGAQRYLWCEPDPGASALLRAYGQPEVLRQAAEIIRSWADEDPRALWERLKAEGPIRGVEAGEVARWQVGTAWSIGGKDFTGPGAGYAVTAAEGAPIRASDGRVDIMRPQTPGKLAQRLDHAPTFPAIAVHPDAREVDPFRLIPCPACEEAGGMCGTTRCTGWARLPKGTVCFIDPPYVGTTGYGHDLPREDVVAMARRWKEAGALVCISEQEPLPELMAEGWHALDITSTRRGQRRTFGGTREWLTMSEPPKWRPAEQMGLFGRTQVDTGRGFEDR
jgi:hypothetical protein